MGTAIARRARYINATQKFTTLVRNYGKLNKIAVVTYEDDLEAVVLS